jgi:hypothetical protein
MTIRNHDHRVQDVAFERGITERIAKKLEEAEQARTRPPSGAVQRVLRATGYGLATEDLPTLPPAAEAR